MMSRVTDRRLTQATVRHIVETARFRTRVVAGHRGIDTVVRWAHVCEMSDPWEWLDSGDFLMTIGYGMPTEPSQQEHFVEALATAGVSGVTIAEDVRAPHITDQMMAAADRVGLPLMRTAFEIPFVTISQEVIDANQHVERARLRRTERLYECVRTAAMTGGRTVDLLESVATELDSELIVVDLTTWTEVFAPGTLVAEDLRGHLEEALLQSGGHLPGILRLQLEGAAMVSVAVPSLHPVALVVRGGPGGPPELSLLQHAATIVAVEVERLQAERVRRQRQGAELLAALLQNRIEISTAMTTLREWRFPDASLAVAVCRRSEWGDDDARLSHWLAADDIPSLLLRQGQDLIVLLPDDQASQEALFRAAGQDVSIGLRDNIGGLSQFPDRVREARWALGHLGDDRVARYGDDGGHFLPRTIAEAQAAVDHVLGPVVEYDRRRGTDLVRSLAVLLGHNRSAQQAADELYIHRQTLVARMKRVEMLTGRDLGSIADVSELWQALRAIELLEGRL